MKSIVVSVVIALQNEERFIGACIDSFLKQTIKKELMEILVVDGMSNDKSKDIVKDYQLRYPQTNIRILDNPKKIQAAGWNIGFKQARGQYVLMMGAHTVVTSDFLEKNLEAHRKHDVPCTGGIVRAVGDDKKSKSIALAFNTPFGAGNAKYWFGTKEEFVETVAFGLYKKKVFNEVGYIDENIIRGQDWEFNYRITKKMGKVLFSPDIKSFYHARSNFRKLWKRQFQAGFWKIYIFKKHPNSILIRQLIPISFSFVLLLIYVIGLFTNFWAPFFVVSGSYLVTNFGCSLYYSLRRNLSFAPYLFVAYPIIHLAYGFGALCGLIYYLFRCPDRTQ